MAAWTSSAPCGSAPRSCMWCGVSPAASAATSVAAHHVLIYMCALMVKKVKRLKPITYIALQTAAALHVTDRAGVQPIGCHTHTGLWPCCRAATRSPGLPLNGLHPVKAVIHVITCSHRRRTHRGNGSFAPVLLEYRGKHIFMPRYFLVNNLLAISDRSQLSPPIFTCCSLLFVN